MNRPTTLSARRIGKTFAVAALGATLAGLAHSQTYRDANPLVDTSSFNNLSVNVNLIEPSDAQMQQILGAGFKFFRYEPTWAGIETKKGVYNWTIVDRIMARAKAKGLRVMLLLAYGNPLYTADTGAPNTPTSRAAFAKFAAAAAARYKRQGVIWEIYNEPNLEGWWRNPNPVDYAALVNATCDAIRAVSPDEWIVGLTTDMLSNDNRAYIETVLSTPGVLANLDGVAFHPYTKSNPETMAAQWTAVRNLIDSKRPADHPVALMAGEVGYLRAWSGITQDLQASYSVRLALFNLTQGVGFTNIYSYDDVEGNSASHSSAGLTSFEGNVPYPAYYAMQRMTAGLRGYKFSKRLDLGRSDDYSLLFVNQNDPTDTRIVCWTTGAPHTMNVPSSAVGFTRTDLSPSTNSAFSVHGFFSQKSKTASSSTGLAVAATGEPVLFASQGPNPLLSLAAAWAKLPSSLTLSTRSEAVSQLGSMVVSPAWASMPAGATLKVEDVAAPVAGYVRPSFSTTLSGLPSLTLASPTVQALFSSLGALQDASDGERTLRFTVQLPDGTSVTQTATTARRQPMALYATAPSNWALTLRVDNPTGAPFRGTLKAYSGTVAVPQALSFVQGETFKMAYFPSLPTTLVGNDLRYELYDLGGNAVDPGRPTIESAAGTVYRAPNFVREGGWTVKLTRPTNITGTTTLGYGVANWSFLTGGLTADVQYSFGAGGSAYVAMNAPIGLASARFAKEPISLGMWVKGDGSKNYIRAVFADSTNQSFQATFGAMDWTGWKWVSVPLAGAWTAHWGGANDGVVHGAMRCMNPLILDSNQLGTAGRVSFWGLTVVGQK